MFEGFFFFSFFTFIFYWFTFLFFYDRFPLVCCNYCCCTWLKKEKKQNATLFPLTNTTLPRIFHFFFQHNFQFLKNRSEKIVQNLGPPLVEMPLIAGTAVPYCSTRMIQYPFTMSWLTTTVYFMYHVFVTQSPINSGAILRRYMIWWSIFSYFNQVSSEVTLHPPQTLAQSWIPSIISYCEQYIIIITAESTMDNTAVVLAGIGGMYISVLYAEDFFFFF